MPGPGISPGIGFLADEAILYNSPDGESLYDKHRIGLNIENTDVITGLHFFAALKAGLDMRKNLRMTRTAIKYLRRYQAKKIVLEAIERNSSVYGDSIKMRSKLKVKNIQKRITEENYNAPVPYETDSINKYSKWVSIKNKVSRGFWEKLNIAWYKIHAYRKFNKKSKRDLAMVDINHQIAYHKKILQGHLFHNFNIKAINWGRISKENGYEGIFPDPRDYRYVRGMNAPTNNTPNRSMNNNNTQGNGVNVTNQMQNTNVNQNINTNANNVIYLPDSNEKNHEPIHYSENTNIEQNQEVVQNMERNNVKPNQDTVQSKETSNNVIYSPDSDVKRHEDVQNVEKTNVEPKHEDIQNKNVEPKQETVQNHENTNNVIYLPDPDVKKHETVQNIEKTNVESKQEVVQKNEKVSNEPNIIKPKNINIKGESTEAVEKVKKGQKVKLKKVKMSNKKDVQLNRILKDYSENGNIHIVTNNNKTR